MALQAKGSQFDPDHLHQIYPSVAQPGSAPALGAGGREFDPLHSDHAYWGFAKLVKAADFDSAIPRFES